MDPRLGTKSGSILAIGMAELCSFDHGGYDREVGRKIEAPYMMQNRQCKSPV